MLTFLIGFFFLLHGLVHLLYAGQSGRLFELRPGMTWPDEAWLFSKLLGDPAVRLLATGLLVVAALGWFAGGLGLFLRQEWWRPAAAGAAVLSAAIFLLFWDGTFRALDEKGGVGLLISLAVLAISLVLK